MRPLLCAGLLLAVLTTHAAEPETAGDSMDVLRQRLSEKLTKEPAGQVKLMGRGGKDAVATKAKPAPRRELPPWGYEGEGGPEHWAALNPDNALCAAGKRQSPIDIKDTLKVDLEKIRFEYQPSAFSVIDDGRTVRVDVSAGNAITVMGRRYELQQFHFHRPAEERLGGRQFDMVVHLVHKDAEGHLAIVAVLLDRDLDDKTQPVIQQVWNNLPLEQNQPLAASMPLDPRQLLPEDRSYYTYMGSLTEPPCTEGVLWMVMRQPVLLTKDQIAIFAKLHPMNARPIQPSSGRWIKESQ